MKIVKKLFQILVFIVCIPFRCARLLQGFLLERPVACEVINAAFLTYYLILAGVSAALWHSSAVIQENLAMTSSMDAATILSLNRMAAILNTNAAMLALASTIIAGLHAWLNAAVFSRSPRNE